MNMKKTQRISSKEQFYGNLNFILVTFIIVFSVIKIDHCNSQPTFQKTIGTVASDGASSLIQTTDGGYVMTGYTFVAGTGSNGEIYTMKLDAGGSLLWKESCGLSGFDFGSSLIQTTDGGILVLGSTSPTGAAPSDIYIQKLNNAGTPLWDKTIGSTGADYGYSIIRTTDGGFAIAGYTNSFGAGGYDCYVVKLDTGGVVQWNKTLGGTGTDVSYSIKQTTDNGYIIAGSTNSYGAGSTDFYIAKLDNNGNLQWSRTCGGAGSEEARSVVQTSDGGFVAAGYTNSYGAGDYDSYFVKFDAAGTLLWSRTAGGVNDDRIFSISQTTDTGFVSAGYTTSFGAGLNDINIVKLNSVGSVQWCKTIGGPLNDNASSIIKTSDGGYAITGITVSFGAGFSDVFFVKIDGSGNSCGNFSSYSPSTGTGGTMSNPVSIAASQIPVITIPAYFINSPGSLSSLCLVGTEPVSNEVPGSYELDQNYPNPFNPTTNIGFRIADFGFVSVKVFDVTGKEVAILVNEDLSPGIHNVDFDASQYSSGIYFYRMTAGDYSQIRKMVLIK